MKSLDPGTVEVNRDMIAVDDLIKEVPLRRAGEVEAKLEEMKKKINDLKQKYKHNSEYEQHVFRFCYIKRSEMDLCEKLYGTRNAVTGEVKNRMVSVNDLMKQVKRSTTGEVVKAMKKALQETNTLELDYMWSRKYSHHVTRFCTIQRLELEWYINLYEAQIEEDRSFVVAAERAAKIFKELKDEATSKRQDISSEELNEMFNHVDKHLWCINSWYEKKVMELSRYKEVLPAQAPKAPRNTDGEKSKLLV
ncbi:uncharacterized protein LOC128509849 [Clarias gariepinus]|uniref:uncharacterized protein LOC128509849 n=1 Tax=Clarias gariepinus TaxID=13013 RepID=UPI00234DE1BD|nr:uncharacterized protein LOC128509849 [Clarias gariepinus]